MNKIVKIIRYRLDNDDFVDFIIGEDERGFWVRPVLKGILWERCVNCPLSVEDIWALLCGMMLDDVEVVDVSEVDLYDLGSGVSSLSDFVNTE